MKVFSPLTLLYFGLIVGITGILYAYLTHTCICEGFNSKGPWTSSTGNGYSSGGEKYYYQFPNSNTIVVQGPGFTPSDKCVPAVGATITLASSQLNTLDTKNLTGFSNANVASGTTVTEVNGSHPNYAYGITLTLSKPHTFPITPSGEFNVGLGYVFTFSFDKCSSTNTSASPVSMASNSPSSSSSSSSSSSPRSSSSSPSSLTNYMFILPPRSY